MQQTCSSCPIKEYETALTIQQDTKTKQPCFGQLLQKITKCGEMLSANANINKSYYFPGQCFPTVSSKGLFYHLIFVAEIGDGVTELCW